MNAALITGALIASGVCNGITMIRYQIARNPGPLEFVAAFLVSTLVYTALFFGLLELIA